MPVGRMTGLRIHRRGTMEIGVTSPLQQPIEGNHLSGRMLFRSRCIDFLQANDIRVHALQLRAENVDTLTQSFRVVVAVSQILQIERGNAHLCQPAIPLVAR